MSKSNDNNAPTKHAKDTYQTIKIHDETLRAAILIWLLKLPN